LRINFRVPAGGRVIEIISDVGLSLLSLYRFLKDVEHFISFKGLETRERVA
jgi:hypothetical protein